MAMAVAVGVDVDRVIDEFMPAHADPLEDEARRIAMANKKKPWAKRWLREHGHGR